MLPENPILIFLLVLLSILSFIFCWNGFRGSNLPNGVIGIALGLPTFAIEDWQWWAAGFLCLGLGLWLRRKMEGY